MHHFSYHFTLKFRTALLAFTCLFCLSAVNAAYIVADIDSGVWDVAATWSNNAALNGGLDYLVDKTDLLSNGAYSVRTPDVTGASRTFGGKSLTLNNGRMIIKTSNSLEIDDLRLNGAGVITFWRSDVTCSLSGNISLSGTNNQFQSTNNTLLDITSTLSGDGQLVILGSGSGSTAGSGQVSLSGDNTGFTGDTKVTNGWLVVNNANALVNSTLDMTGMAAGGGAVTLGSSATAFNLGGLKGGGANIIGDVTISGIHAPGSSPGLDTITGDLTYSGGSSEVQWELASNAIGVAGTNFDQIQVGNDLDFSGATSLSLIFDSTGSTVKWSDSFWQSEYLGTDGWLVFDVDYDSNGGGLSNFSNLNLSSTYLDSDGIALPSYYSFGLEEINGDIYLTFAIPEPSTMLLAGLGLAGLVLRRRKRK
ncbi:MAG: PEP-CTERM sorting domain-containing protein [Lentisphaeria bacterium]|nr:PEP-CTERM sorting domain-containing protein [Lentisphaeria bacterium]